MNKPVKKIVIVGGGTAGWMAAVALSERHKRQTPNNWFALLDDDAATPLALYSYAYYFDGSRYPMFLRNYTEQREVGRVRQTEDGCIQSISLENDIDVVGDLFIDCTGFRSLRVEQTLKPALRTGVSGRLATARRLSENKNRTGQTHK